MISSPNHDHRLSRLHRLTMQVNAARELTEALHLVVALAHESGSLMSHVCLFTTDDGCPRCRGNAFHGAARSERRLHFVARAGAPMEPDNAHIFPAGWGMVDEVVRTHRPLRLIHNADAIVRSEMLETPRRFPEFGLRVEDVQHYLKSVIKSVAFFPLISRDTLLGVLCTSFAREVDDEEFTWLSLCASQAAFAIERSQLREKLQELQTVRPTPRHSVSIVAQRNPREQVVGRSPAFRALNDLVERAAATNSTVLITGETGTGKELVARAIHRLGNRREQPLVTLNCGAVAPSLIESELFGHERGAFTGALQRRVGRIESAHRGTLFLDELSELPLDGQVKLLRVLQEHELERVGSSHAIRVDFRLIAATNRDLENEVAADRFREDLLFRVNVLQIQVPPLRSRKEDIPLLAHHFIDHFRHDFGAPARDLTRDALDKLMCYDWPGNIRELRNVLERACVLATSAIIEADGLRLPDTARGHAALRLTSNGDSHADGHGGAARPHGDASAASAAETLTTFEEHERRYLRRVLATTNGRVDGPRGAAAILGMNPSTLRSRLQRLGIRRIEDTAS
jgi:formate hydrogenlyase transcriptional activator